MDLVGMQKPERRETTADVRQGGEAGEGGAGRGGGDCVALVEAVAEGRGLQSSSPTKLSHWSADVQLSSWAEHTAGYTTTAQSASSIRIGRRRWQQKNICLAMMILDD